LNEEQNTLAQHGPSAQLLEDTKKQFTFNVTKPFANPDRPKQKFLIDGLLKEGGLASLVAKPKQGKSSLSRYAAVCVAKGEPFLGRRTVRGEVLLITIEDSVEHVENCLTVLKWNPEQDASIDLIENTAAKAEDNISALRQVLKDNPGIRLVVIDTFPKFGRVKDMNEYAPWLKVFDGLKKLRAEFPSVSFLCLLHAKKTIGDDFFDSMLGSSALRGEFDSNIALYQECGQRIIRTECRMGKAIPPTIIKAVPVEFEGCDVVKSFALGQKFDTWSETQENSKEKKRKANVEERIISHLSAQDKERAVYKLILEEVKGKDADIIAAINTLIKDAVLKESGTKNSPMDPYTLTLDRTALQMRDFTNRFDKKGAANVN
jgi:hypothetical protein